MQIGYARVSTDDQDTAVQVVAFRAAGASGPIVRRRPVDVGIGPNFTGYSTNFAKVICSWSGNSAGFLAHSVPY
jgi:hypothetical protein